MKIKKYFTLVIISSFPAVISLVSCESHEQKADDAFELVKNEKMAAKDTIVITKEVSVNDNKNKAIKISANLSEWDKFKIETENKIILNENKIKKIKGTPNLDAKLLRKATSLEKDNTELRKKMDLYNEEAKVIWENFKTEMNHNVNEISIELKNIKLNDEK